MRRFARGWPNVQAGRSARGYTSRPLRTATLDVLRQLAFASRARPGLRSSDTSAIIGACRASNASAGITGVLLYSGESFLQLVEGPDAALSALWRELAVDARQRQLVSLHDAGIASRAFADWRAGYVAEVVLAPAVERWRRHAGALPAGELVALLAFVREAATF
ncbi:MAG: BLUF domain-containing protein [Solirubrobacterales bacterium]|nr:BLUF domain-containing protein [Solirubrobacterales bacterium]